MDPFVAGTDPAQPLLEWRAQCRQPAFCQPAVAGLWRTATAGTTRLALLPAQVSPAGCRSGRDWGADFYQHGDTSPVAGGLTGYQPADL